MPVRSLNSAVFKWPDKETVHQAAEAWARDTAAANSSVVRIGYFGSYATGNWGVGSDLDLIVIVESSARPPMERPLDFPATGLPVPCDVVVYTQEEWARQLSEGRRFARTVEAEGVWLLDRSGPS